MSAASHPSSEPRSSSGALAAWGIAAVVAATVLPGALLPSRHAVPPRSVAEDPACLEWTDGCQVCQRHADGPACSLPGIACQPATPHCLRRADG